MNIFPAGHCLICGAPSESPFEPCRSCSMQMLRDTGPRCTFCTADLAGSLDPCPSCREETSRLLDGLAAIGPWNGVLREWISRYKYGGDSRMAVWTAIQLCRIADNLWPNLPIVPVPPRRLHLHQTGFDPVAHLAGCMHRLGRTVLPLLRRHGNRAQKKLSREERIKAQALDFRLRRHRVPLPDSCILLDDVSTTGSTLRYCAGILKAAGVRCVYGLAAAKET